MITIRAELGVENSNLCDPSGSPGARRSPRPTRARCHRWRPSRPSARRGETQSSGSTPRARAERDGARKVLLCQNLAVPSSDAVTTPRAVGGKGDIPDDLVVSLEHRHHISAHRSPHADFPVVGGCDREQAVGAEGDRDDRGAVVGRIETGRPDVASQILAVPSTDAVPIVMRLRHITAAVRGPVWPRNVQALSGGGVPESCGSVVRAGDDTIAVGIELGARDRPLVSAESCDLGQSAARQRRAVPSLDAVRILVPSGL